MIRTVSENGIKMIKSFEKPKLKAYKAVSTEKYYTIGYGHYGSDVTKDMIITQSQAEQLLKQDLENAIRHVNGYMKTYDFNQNEFDAMVSFAFNVGNITQLTKLGTRNKTTIANKILQYNKSGGKVLNGLVTRRKKERELFLTPVDGNDLTSVKYKTIAQEVVAGKWGNGSIRKQKLTNAGYDYSKVQQYVNKLLGK